MSWLFEHIILPLIIGVVTGLIVELIKARITGRSLSVRPVVAVGLLVALVAVAVTLLLPPYKVMDVRWCSNADGSVRVTGRLGTLILASAVPNYTVQIKIYVAGHGDPPFKGAGFPTTNVEGRFDVTFPPPPPSPGTLYVINTAYKYDSAFFTGQWRIMDFNAADPPPCTPIKSPATIPSESGMGQIGIQVEIRIEFIRPQEGDRVSQFTDVEYRVYGSLPAGYRDVLLVQDPLGQYWSWGTPVGGNIKIRRVQMGVAGDQGRMFRIIALISDRDIPLGTPYQTLPRSIYQNSIVVTRQ